MELSLDWGPVIKVSLAMFLGGLMGLERELARKPAGLRTHILVSGAASLLVVLGEIMIGQYSGDNALAKSVEADPIRIMGAVITGISFLGAGTIIFRDQGETVEGLTTAASILFVAGIGIGVALHQYLLASILTILAIVVLMGLGYLERFIAQFRQRYYDNTFND